MFTHNTRCCIDKTSSAELSEAINSMFRWYEKAKVCYAYLSDVSGDANLKKDVSEFVGSRWFTRGWTLQELVAPKSVLFYSRRYTGWHFLGTKEDLCDHISAVTGIDTDTLYGAGLELASVARKMSWASHRETTRVEDTAYCLLGIFDVNMPLLYGEGKKAFLRLQEEILRSSYDYSLFAWGLNLTSVSDLEKLVTAEREKPDILLYPERGGRRIGEPHLRGLLAGSPADFRGSHDVEPSLWADRIHASQVPPVIHNRCVHIDFLIVEEVDYEEVHNDDQDDPERNLKVSVAVLGYHPQSRSGDYLGLVLKGWGNGLYSGRMHEPILVPPRYVEESKLPAGDLFRTSTKRVRIKEEPPHQANLEGCFTLKDLPSMSNCQLGKVLCVAGARYDRRNRVLSSSPGRFGPQALFTFTLVENGDQFGVVVARGTGHSGSPSWACIAKLLGRGSSFDEQVIAAGAKDLYSWPKTQSSMRALLFKINDKVEVEVKLRPSRTVGSMEDLVITLHHIAPPVRAQRSNLTASLRAMRATGRSISSLQAPMIPSDEFLTRSIISIDPQVPFTDEGMPSRLEDSPASSFSGWDGS